MHQNYTIKHLASGLYLSHHGEAPERSYAWTSLPEVASGHQSAEEARLVLADVQRSPDAHAPPPPYAILAFRQKHGVTTLDATIVDAEDPGTPGPPSPPGLPARDLASRSSGDAVTTLEDASEEALKTAFLAGATWALDQTGRILPGARVQRAAAGYALQRLRKARR